MQEHIGIQKGPKNTTEAVKMLTKESSVDSTVRYLKKHPEDIMEFCVQMFKSYGKDDNWAMLRLGFVVGKLVGGGVDHAPHKEGHNEDFIKSIESNKDLTKEEAIKKLSDFHDVDPKFILKAFPKLDDVKDGDYVVFESSVYNGAPCLAMCVYSKGRLFKSSSYINKKTGEPLESIN